jgi:hypothetical protein
MEECWGSFGVVLRVSAENCSQQQPDIPQVDQSQGCRLMHIGFVE